LSLPEETSGVKAVDHLAILLALQGIVILAIGLIAGLFLHRAIRLGHDTAAWHLAHSGGSGRGVLLLALAGTLRLVALGPSQLSLAVWLIAFFAWTSVLAMMVAAASGERGLTGTGSLTSRLVFWLYVAGAITVFPGVFLLIAGLLQAL
jgi:hypothetical protein